MLGFLTSSRNFFGRLFRGRKNALAVQENIDKKLVYSLSKSKIPNLSQFKYLKKFLSSRELRILTASFGILALSLVFLAVRFYAGHVRISPVAGGEYIEGVIGSPKYINPLYASVSDVDSDLSRLIFSSLMKRGADGQITNDLAKSYEVSPDGKNYVFKIRMDARWHNDKPVMADDIVFTFNTLKDFKYNSPLRKRFAGVEIEKIDDETIRFNLTSPYTPFPELLDFGILPQEIWYKISPNAASLATYNLRPVGSGPYRYESLIKDQLGYIKAYKLVRNENYYGESLFLEKVTFKFFPGQEELVKAEKDGTIDGGQYEAGGEDGSGPFGGNFHVFNLETSQLNAIFFNQKNNASLSDKKVRQALSLAIDKEAIVKDGAGFFGRKIDSPIAAESFAYTPEPAGPRGPEEAAKILEAAGWQSAELKAEDIAKANEEAKAEDEKIRQAAELRLAMGEGKWRAKDGNFLVVKLTAADTAENNKVTETVKGQWEKIGVKVAKEIIPGSDIQSLIIKPRNFEALLYGQIVGADPDCYAFWHSTQAGEGGGNLADFSHKEADQLLEDARTNLDANYRREKYQRFQTIIYEETPAVYLYSPYYPYAQNKNVQGFSAKKIFLPEDRLAGIDRWYLKVGRKIVW